MYAYIANQMIFWLEPMYYGLAEITRDRNPPVNGLSLEDDQIGFQTDPGSDRGDVATTNDVAIRPHINWSFG